MWAVAFAALAGGLGALDAATIAGITADYHEYRAAGGSVSVLETNSGGADGERCEMLSLRGAATTGADASGALRPAQPVRLAALPGSDISTWEATPGFGNILISLGMGHNDTTGVWVADDLATALGVAPGDDLVTTTGSTPVAGVYPWPDDGRNRSLAFAIVAPVPRTGDFDSCWISEQAGPAVAEDLLLLVADDSDVTSVITPLNSELAAIVDPLAEFRSRPTRFAVGAIIAAAAALALASTSFRRLELAAAAHAGAARVDIAVQHTIESGAWLVIGGALALPLLVVGALVGGASHDTLGAVLPALRAVGGAVITGLGAAFLCALAIDDRRLLRYFKDR